MSENRGAYLVWARVLSAAIDVAEKGGLSCAEILEGLPFDATSLRRMRRVDWVDYCAVVERIEVQAGGLEAVQRLLASSYHDVLPEMQALARTLVSPRLLVRLIFDLINPSAFPAVEFRTEDLGGDRVRVRTWLRPGARSCLAWFGANVGAAMSIPRQLGLPPAEIIAADVGPRHGTYEFMLPASRTVSAHLERVARAVTQDGVVAIVLGHGEDGTPVGATFRGDAPSLGERLDAAERAWGLGPREVDVLRFVVYETSDEHIARSLRWSNEVAARYVTAILAKAGAASREDLVAGFWSDAFLRAS